VSTGGEPEFGSGAYYGGGQGNRGDVGPGPGLPGLGSIFGMGSPGSMRGVGPAGPYGAWPSCGCSSFFIILAGFLLVFGGCLRMLGQ
jgi:hypothetical protein